MKHLYIILRSIIYVPLFIMAFGWLALYVRVFDPEIGIIIPLKYRTIGIVLMVVGSILLLLCIIEFIFRGKGTPAVFDPPTLFVATGPYAYVRNPMYIGGFVLLTGFGLFQTSISILILTVILIFLFHLFVVFFEEPVLTKLFGDSYLNYKKYINRWIPKGKKYIPERQ